jgi:hypothetical protein
MTHHRQDHIKIIPPSNSDSYQATAVFPSGRQIEVSPDISSRTGPSSGKNPFTLSGITMNYPDGHEVKILKGVDAHGMPAAPGKITMLVDGKEPVNKAFIDKYAKDAIALLKNPALMHFFSRTNPGIKDPSETTKAGQDIATSISTRYQRQANFHNIAKNG